MDMQIIFTEGYTLDNPVLTPKGKINFKIHGQTESLKSTPCDNSVLPPKGKISLEMKCYGLHMIKFTEEYTLG